MTVPPPADPTALAPVTPAPSLVPPEIQVPAGASAEMIAVTNTMNQARLLAAGQIDKAIGMSRPAALPEGLATKDQLDQYRADMKTYNAKLAVANQNVMLPKMKELQANYESATNVLNAGDKHLAGQEYLGEAVKLQVAAQKGIQDELSTASSREQSKGVLVSQLMSFNLVGAFMSLLKMIPGVGSMIDNAMSTATGTAQQALEGNDISLDTVGKTHSRVQVAGRLQSAFMGALGSGMNQQAMEQTVTALLTPPPQAATPAGARTTGSTTTSTGNPNDTPIIQVPVIPTNTQTNGTTHSPG